MVEKNNDDDEDERGGDGPNLKIHSKSNKQQLWPIETGNRRSRGEWEMKKMDSNWKDDGCTIEIVDGRIFDIQKKRGIEELKPVRNVGVGAREFCCTMFLHLPYSSQSFFFPHKSVFPLC